MEVEFPARLKDAVYRCGNVNDGVDKVTFFINFSSPSIRTIIACYWENQPRSTLMYNVLVQLARDEGESI